MNSSGGKSLASSSPLVPEVLLSAEPLSPYLSALLADNCCKSNPLGVVAAFFGVT